jgi:hypothetical protein
VEPAQGDAGHADYVAYMEQEHLAQMAKEPGWVRTKRYKLVTQIKGTADVETEAKSGKKIDATSWLALYEFDERNKLGTEVQACVPMTDWTKRISKEARWMELGVWHKMESFE